jgi:hypothetical protein
MQLQTFAIWTESGSSIASNLELHLEPDFIWSLNTHNIICAQHRYLIIKLERLWIVSWGAIFQRSSKWLPAGHPAGCSVHAQWVNCRPAKMLTVLLDWLPSMSSFEAICSSLSFLAMQPLFGTRQGRFGINGDVPWSHVIHAVLNFNFYQLAVLQNYLTTWDRTQCKCLFH